MPQQGSPCRAGSIQHGVITWRLSMLLIGQCLPSSPSPCKASDLDLSAVALLRTDFTYIAAGRLCAQPEAAAAVPVRGRAHSAPPCSPAQGRVLVTAVQQAAVARCWLLAVQAVSVALGSKVNAALEGMVTKLLERPLLFRGETIQGSRQAEYRRRHAHRPGTQQRGYKAHSRKHCLHSIQPSMVHEGHTSAAPQL